LHKAKGFKYLGVFEEVPQGVRARVIPRVLEDFKEAQEGITPSKCSKGIKRHGHQIGPSLGPEVLLRVKDWTVKILQRKFLK